MRPLFRAWMLLPIIAILFIAGLFWARQQAAQGKKDPLTQAQDWVRDSFGMTVEKATTEGDGLKVEVVSSGGAAAAVGIKAGDRIIAVGERSVWHVYQLTTLIAKWMNGPVAPVLVASGKGDHQVLLPLGGIQTEPPNLEEEGEHNH